MSRYLLGLSLGLSLALFAGCSPSTPPVVNPTMPSRTTDPDGNHGFHVTAPGVNVDGNK